MISRFLLTAALLGATRAFAADPAPATPPVATKAASAAPAPAAAVPAPPQKTAAPAVENSRRANNAAAAASAAANPQNVDAFRIIPDRNIFNANRTGRRERSAEDQGPRLEQITFVGTVDYAKGKFAIFDGTDAAARKGLRPGDSVAGYKITAVAGYSIDLERDGKPLTLQMGQQFRRAEGGEWTIIGADLARSEAQARAAQQAANATPVISNDVSDIERRMRERRNQPSK